MIVIPYRDHPSVGGCRNCVSDFGYIYYAHLCKQGLVLMYICGVYILVE